MLNRFVMRASLLGFLGLISFITAVAKEPVVSSFGRLPDGREARLFTLEGDAGFRVEITDFGGAIVRIITPDRDGRLADVVLGFSEVAPYADVSPYFGALIGRVANRIAGGKFTLDGREFMLPTNNAPNNTPCHLHGGPAGFHKVLWHAEPTTREGRPALRLTHVSPDGESGYPGTLHVEVLYSLTADRGLRIDFQATTDRRTPVNLSTHSYFNLRGEDRGTILDHRLQIAATRYTPVGPDMIPLGEHAEVGGTPFDFTSPQTIGARIAEHHVQLVTAKGYDHNFVLNSGGAAEPVLAATVYEPESGRVLELLTTKPGVQFYSGNFLKGTLTGKTGNLYPLRSGFCLEPQAFPDAVNQEKFPCIILEPGQAYRSASIYRFSAR
jgi:aldose 1-epimerase